MSTWTFPARIAFCSSLLLLTWQLSLPAQEFRSLLSGNQAGIPNVYQGSFVTGNTTTHTAIMRNTSNRAFVIDGVANIVSLDPEDLGFPDLTQQNSNAIIVAMARLYPTYDLFNTSGWVTIDPIRMIWNTEITFTEPFPILVNPGEFFQYTRVSQNQFFGPDFGPINAPASETHAHLIGEVAVAFDFDWHYVPEPHLGALLALVGPSMALRRRLAPWASLE